MPNTIDDYALITADEGVDALELGDNQDAINTLILFINGITELVERYTGREFLSRARTETFDGDGTNRHILKNGLNTTAVATVVYNEDDDEVPADSIKFNPYIGEVYLDDNYAFERGFQNCSITYTAGLTTVPEAIKLATIMILKKFWKDDDAATQTISSMTIEGQAVTFKAEDIPAEAKGILDLYIRPGIS